MEQTLGRHLYLAHRSVHDELDRRLYAHGASLWNWVLLREAANAGGASQRELAELMQIEPPTLVRHLDKLTEEGLVERRPDPDDRRVVRVVVTAAGSKRLAELHAVVHEFDGELRGILTKRETEVLERALARIHTYFEQYDVMPQEVASGRDDVVMRTDKLTKIYPGGLKAVDELDLEVHRGEIFGLLGPNGAGKTTTAGMLTTRVIPTSGHAYVGGIDVVAHPTAAKQVIGVVPQTNTLDRSLTVWENLYFHGRFFGMSAPTSRAEADRLLQQFRLADRAKELVAALSGGMAQRLMVARAIMHRPATLFLDEPTAGLDPQSRLALWEILGELHAAGQTILLTTHYMEEADELCNRLAIIDHGHLLSLGTPAELKRSTGADTIVTVSATGDLDLLAKALEAEVPGVAEVTRVDETLLVAVKAQTGVLPIVFNVADRHGFAVSDLSVTEPTLETVFINLTGKDLRE